MTDDVKITYSPPGYARGLFPENGPIQDLDMDTRLVDEAVAFQAKMHVAGTHAALVMTSKYHRSKPKP